MNPAVEVDTGENEEKALTHEKSMRRNLMDVFDKSELPTAQLTDERMSIYLRIRPFSTEEQEKGENQECVEVQNDYTVSATAPKESHTYKTTTYGLGKAAHHFTFSHVFPESTTQKEFFGATMLKMVQDFIEGQNCLVFAYGVTNSGKTYTIQGNPQDAGVLPRALDVLFNSISGKQWPTMNLKPCMFNDVVTLSSAEEEEEHRLKERILKMNTNEDLDVMTLLGDDASDQSGNVMNATSQSDSSAESKEKLENGVREEMAVDIADQEQTRFSVWVSFAEIYNEQIFDLLERMPKKKDAKRSILKLSDDRRGSPYIKGLKEINVTSVDEAYKLLTIGQRNLKTACTRLNHNSSRSHCIFNIKIIRVADKADPQCATVSMLSLCDLAGSERHGKTHTTGERLREAGNINTSLHTLGRCMEQLRANQLQKKDSKHLRIPFRDSQLTRLFQNFFCGRGKASMIVNVSQNASMFDETLNVFKFSAIAKQVVMPSVPAEKAPEVRLKRKASVGKRARTVTEDRDLSAILSHSSSREASHQTARRAERDDDDPLARVSDEEERAAYTEFLEQKIKKLQHKMKEMNRQRLAREVEIRQEVCKEMQEQLAKTENMYNNLLRETQQEGEDRLEKKIKLVLEYSKPTPSKRPRLEDVSNETVRTDQDDEWVPSLLLHQERVKVQECKARLLEAQEQAQQLQTRVEELQCQVDDLTQENKDLLEKARNTDGQQTKTERRRLVPRRKCQDS